MRRRRLRTRPPWLVLSLLAVLGAAPGACSDAPRRGLGELCTADANCDSGVCSYGVCLDPSVDADHDGLTNGLEAALGSNPFNPDTDYDGVPDGQEVDEDGAPDSDGDGIPDILESRIADADEDCLPDELDPDGSVATDLAAVVPLRCEARGVCGAHPEAVRIRCDAHGQVTCLYDAVPGWEAFERTCDGLDNDCDGRADEGHPDLDGDQIADCVDPDRDGDGAPDVSDNCPALVNATQDDADGDGLGDACDPPAAPLVTSLDPPSPGHLANIHLRGSAEPFASVAVFRADAADHVADPAALGTGVAGADGALDVPVVVAPGATRFLAQATNRAGLQSALVPLGPSYLLDLDRPAPPVLTGAAFIQATGATGSNGGGQLRFFLDGAVEPAAAVALHALSDCSDVAIGVADGAETASGHWFVDAKVATATTVLYAQATDVAGNVSDCGVLVSLEGDIVLEAMFDGLLRPDATIQIHDAFGKPKQLLTTDANGRVTAHIRAGDGATAALTTGTTRLPQSWRWVSTLGLVPGGTARIGTSVKPATKGASEPLTTLQLHWPAAPAGATQYCVHLPCGPQCVDVGPETKSGASISVAPACLVSGASTPTFVTTEDGAGNASRFAVATLDPAGGSGAQLGVEITAWRSDWAESDLVVASDADGGSFVAQMGLEVNGLGYPMNLDGTPLTGFAAPGTSATVTRLFPSMPGAAASWQLIAGHVAVGTGNALGVRGIRGRAPSLPYRSEVDFDVDLLPRVYQSEVQWTDVRPKTPIGITWGADPTLGEQSDVMSVAITARMPQVGTVQWTIFARATQRDALAIPTFAGTFPGATTYAASSDISVTGPIFFEAPAVDGFEGFLLCGGDPACLGGAQGVLRWSSCCEQH